jgi:protoporphyrinogen oxidase
MVNGIYAGDLVMANSLEILRMLPEAIRRKIKEELEVIIKSGDKKLHASQKKLNEPLFMNTSYEAVSRANHGDTFHDMIIEPLCEKIFNMSSKDCPALLHRIIWTPLFYPETLLKGLEGKEDMAPTMFHYPKEAYFAAITESFVKEIKANPNITIMAQKITDIKKNADYEFNLGTESITAKQVVWCNDLNSLLGSAKVEVPEYVPGKASVSIVFCSTAASNIKRGFSCLYVCDASNPVYRITNQEYAAAKQNSDKVKLVLEFNYDVLTSMGLDNNEKVLANMNAFLLQHGIIHKALGPEEMTLKSIKNAVNLPTLNNYNNFEKLFNLTLKMFPEMELVGPASGFVSTSYNDQIVQGLKIGKKYN